MEKESRNYTNFTEICKEALPEYFKDLKSKGFTIQEIKLTKEVIISLIKEYMLNGDSKFAQRDFNVKSLVEFIKHSRISGKKLSRYEIKQTILNFLNYLRMRKLLDRKNVATIQRLNEEQNKLLSSPYTNDNNRQLVEEIKTKFLEVIEELEEIWDNDTRYISMVQYFEEVPESTLIKAILQLFRSIDDSRFQRLLLIIDECLKLDRLPSVILNLLRKRKDQQDDYFFRLLILYQTFFMAGYILKTSFEQLIGELGVDIELFSDYAVDIIKSFEWDNISDPYYHLDDFSSLEKEIRDKIDLKSLIENIVPISKSESYSPEISKQAFNFPEEIQIDLWKRTQHLRDGLERFNKKVKFIHSNWERWVDDLNNSKLSKKINSTNIYYYNGDFLKALRILEKTIKTFPENAYLYYFKAKILEGLGDFFEALKSLLKSLELDDQRIDSYVELAFLLEMGGYFHHSIILSTYLLHFDPFDFNLLLQFAFSSYQLSLPFKNILEIAGRLDPGRLGNFLTRYWFQERIKPRDSVSSLGMSEEGFSKYLDYTNNVIRNISNTINLTTEERRDKKFIQELNEYLINCHNFFPKIEDHIAKNNAAYELGLKFLSAMNLVFYEKNFILPYLVASKSFIDFGMNLSKITIDQIISTYNKRGSKKYYEIDTETILKHESVLNHPMYEPASFFISEEGISRILLDCALNLIQECQECPEQCLTSPYKWSNRFYTLDVPESLKYQANLIQFIEHLYLDFEYWLEEKGLKANTVSRKIRNVEYFLSYLIPIIDEKDKKRIDRAFHTYLSTEIIEKFLENAVLKKGWITTKTNFNYLLNSMKSFIRFYFAERSSSNSGGRKTTIIEYLKQYDKHERYFK